VTRRQAYRQGTAPTLGLVDTTATRFTRPVATDAHDALTTNLTRARYFIDLHEGTQTGPGTPDRKRRELPRGAVVFAVGALDAYLSEVSAE